MRRRLRPSTGFERHARRPGALTSEGAGPRHIRHEGTSILCPRLQPPHPLAQVERATEHRHRENEAIDMGNTRLVSCDLDEEGRGFARTQARGCARRPCRAIRSLNSVIGSPR